jgi:hypothetical protein
LRLKKYRPELYRNILNYFRAAKECEIYRNVMKNEYKENLEKFVLQPAGVNMNSVTKYTNYAPYINKNDILNTLQLNYPSYKIRGKYE